MSSDARLVEDYLNGVPISTLCERAGCRPQAIYDAVDDVLVDRRVGARAATIRELFALGFSTRRISEYFGGLSRSAINVALRDRR